MADLSIIAKPYAKAAYEFASENKSIDDWSSLLKVFSSFVEVKDVSRIINSPMLSQIDIVDSFKDVVDTSFANFLMLMAEHGRLSVLPTIALHYQEICSSHNNTKKAIVTLAYDADDKLLEQLKQKLEKRFECSIDLDVRVNPEIIAGAVIRVGDTVIDGSVSGRLEELKSNLLS